MADERRKGGRQLTDRTRARRVKCDEAKPVCMRCIRAGRRCTGSVFVAHALQSAAPVVPKRMELALHHYFRTHCTTVTVTEFNVEFWHRLLPQMTHSVVPIWHASLALAGAMWSMNDGAGLSHDVITKLDEESARQHSASVQGVMQLTRSSSLSVHDKLTMLLANCMFAMYASRFGNWTSFLAIQANSRRLMREWRFWELVHSQTLSAMATHLLYYFVKSGRMVQESQLAITTEPSESWHEAIEFLQRRPLDSMAGAYLELDMLWTSIKGMLDDLPLWPTEEDLGVINNGRAVFYAQFTRWEERYRVVSASLPHGNPAQVAAVESRRILLKSVFQINFTQTKGLRDETCWDAAGEDFHHVFQVIRSALAKPEELSTGGVNFTPSLWNALNFIARISRDSMLRRQAAGLLRYGFDESRVRLPRNAHGFKQEEPSVRLLVDHIIDLEESFWAECDESPRCVPGRFICNTHRVAKVLVEQPGARPSIFTLLTMGDVRDGLPGRRIVLRVPIWS
ncbi:hypothetical protein PWT90_03550 [Aphanocladium album]|nr:hypothetical protein PWT90_03550 [Aphanocladium album]